MWWICLIKHITKYVQKCTLVYTLRSVIRYTSLYLLNIGSNPNIDSYYSLIGKTAILHIVISGSSPDISNFCYLL